MSSNYDILTNDCAEPDIKRKTSQPESRPHDEPQNDVLIGLLYAFLGTFSYGVISQSATIMMKIE